jgi:hypothetical protein
MTRHRILHPYGDRIPGAMRVTLRSPCAEPSVGGLAEACHSVSAIFRQRAKRTVGPSSVTAIWRRSFALGSPQSQRSSILLAGRGFVLKYGVVQIGSHNRKCDMNALFYMLRSSYPWPMVPDGSPADALATSSPADAQGSMSRRCSPFTSDHCRDLRPAVSLNVACRPGQQTRYVFRGVHHAFAKA